MSAATFASTLNFNKLYDLKGRVALVTGGGTGIGLMIASSLAANGAKVYIASRRVEVLQKVAEDWKAQGQTVIPCVLFKVVLCIVCSLPGCKCGSVGLLWM